MHNSTLFLKIGEDKFADIPSEYRKLFDLLKCEPNDLERFDNDDHYKALNKEYRKVSKELRDYKYNVRNDTNK